MFSINILRFMSNFSFKGDTLYRLIPSGVIGLLIPGWSYGGIQYHGTPANFPHSLHFYYVGPMYFDARKALNIEFSVF